MYINKRVEGNTGNRCLSVLLFLGMWSPTLRVGVHSFLTFQSCAQYQNWYQMFRLKRLIRAFKNPFSQTKVVQQGESKQSIAYKTIQKPYICGTDMLGAQSSSQSFVCSGVASRSLHGTAEALWRPDLEADELVEVCGRAFISALERDCLSGYGAVVYLIQSGDGGDEDDVQIIEYVLACRND